MSLRCGLYVSELSATFDDRRESKNAEAFCGCQRFQDAYVQRNTIPTVWCGQPVLPHTVSNKS